MPAHTVSKVAAAFSEKQHLVIRIGAPTTNKTASVALSVFRFDSVDGFGGRSHVSGVVKIGSTPVKRRVRLYESRTGVLLREQWANDDGTYLFDRLRADLLYTITAHDYDGGYNDVIATNVVPV